MTGRFRKRLMACALTVIIGCHIGPNTRGLNVNYLDDFNQTKGNLVVVYKNRKDLDSAFRFIHSFKWLGNDIEAVKVENPEDYYGKYRNEDFDKLGKEKGFKVYDEDDPVIIHRKSDESGRFKTKVLYRPN